MNDTNEVKRQKIAKYTKWALVFAGAAIISPVIFLAVKGLVGLAIAAVAGLAIVNFAPVVSMKFANWKVKAIVSEAQENPIETMQNLLFAKRQAFQTLKTKVEDSSAAAKNFASRVADFSKKFPHRAPEFQAHLNNMKKMVEQQVVALRAADAVLDEGEHKLEEMKAYWEMSQALQAANKSVGLDTGDLYEKLKADTAADSVMNSVNKAFAQLEVAAELNAVPALENNPSQVIEMEPIKERLEVRA